MLLALALFAAGFLTILLPCILPLVPIVLGVSVAGHHRLRPVAVVLGMVLSFVAFTFALRFFLGAIPAVADIVRIGTFAALFLFGVAFLTGNRFLRQIGCVGAALFYLPYGVLGVVIAAIPAFAAMELGGVIATKIQQFGSNVQLTARGSFGADSPFTAFLIGLTLGLVWVPCAGPALGFAFALVRDEPGLRAAFLLTCYALGTAVPLLLIGYGGQWAVRSVGILRSYTGVVKRVAGVLLIGTAILLQLRTFERLQIWFVDHTPFGNIGTRLETFFLDDAFTTPVSSGAVLTPSTMQLPTIMRAPQWIAATTGPWHGTVPLTATDLTGKVVLLDFWTYSCINCIRTLPHVEATWEKYRSARFPTGSAAFLLVGVHTPEFAFEGVAENVQAATVRYGLTYPVVQDNDYSIWNRFANRYWPAQYLIDAEGNVRYTHFGEGGREETDLAIATLLQEAGATLPAEQAVQEPAEGATGRRDQSPETYVGARGWSSFQNALGDPSDAIIAYRAPAVVSLHRFALDGSWQLVDGEHQVLRSETGVIRMQWQGSQIHLVMGLEDGAPPATAEVWIDGVMTHTFLVDRDDLFTLADVSYGEHELVLRLTGAGVEAYAFTFGS